jgi:hypothetical protein
MPEDPGRRDDQGVNTFEIADFGRGSAHLCTEQARRAPSHLDVDIEATPECDRTTRGEALHDGSWNFCIMAPHPTMSYDHAMPGRVCSIRRLRGLQAVKLRLKPSSRDKGIILFQMERESSTHAGRWGGTIRVPKPTVPPNSCCTELPPLWAASTLAVGVPSGIDSEPMLSGQVSRKPWPLRDIHTPNACQRNTVTTQA